jgi:hypothetical protein
MKTYLATQAQVTTVSNTVTTLNTAVSHPVTGLDVRVTALENASGNAIVGAIIGDTKFSYKTVDHDGWYILDGRLISSFSPTAQAAAVTLGWAISIPNTKGLFPLAASSTITSGTVGGSNNIARSALPNFTLTGNTGNESASHTHTTAAYTISETTAADYATDVANPNVISFPSARTVVSDNGAALAGNDYSFLALDGIDRAVSDASTLHSHAITIDVPTKTSGTASANHTHSYTTSSINGGVAQTAHLPAYSAKTEFVYLGL